MSDAYRHFQQGNYAHFVLGRCLQRRGESTEARAHYKLAVSLRPGNEDYAAALAELAPAADEAPKADGAD